MGAQCSCDKSQESCANKAVDTFRAAETVLLATFDNGYDHSALMLHESLPNQELIRASMEGHEQSVAKQLERGAFIESRRPFKIVFNGELAPKRAQENLGLTPLMHAALGGHAATCALLVTARAEVNAVDEDRMRPLHFAAKAGSLDVFKLLLCARADANCQDTDGLTPLAQLAPWSRPIKADFEALLTTESRSLLPPTKVGTAAAAAASTAAVAVGSSILGAGESTMSATATFGIPESLDLRLLDREPTFAEVLACTSAGTLEDSNTRVLTHVPDADLAVKDKESSDGTAILDGLLQEPNWMMSADSLHTAGEDGKDASSLQDGLTKVDELHNETDIEISESMLCQLEASRAPLPL